MLGGAPLVVLGGAPLVVLGGAPLINAPAHDVLPNVQTQVRANRGDPKNPNRSSPFAPATRLEPPRKDCSIEGRDAPA